MNQNKISDVIRASVENIKSTLDANTIIGEEIVTANGTTIIPVSKLSVGFASGGIDYTGKHNSGNNSNFGGGGGSGVMLTPVAFLVVSPDGAVNLLNVNDKPASDPISQIIGAIERSPELIEKLKTVFAKKKVESSETEEAVAE